jgi:hypothetical protein
MTAGRDFGDVSGFHIDAGRRSYPCWKCTYEDTNEIIELLPNVLQRGLKNTSTLPSLSFRFLFVDMCGPSECQLQLLHFRGTTIRREFSGGPAHSHNGV